MAGCTQSPAADAPGTTPGPSPTGAVSASRTPPAPAAPIASLPCASGGQGQVVGTRHHIVGAVFGQPLMSPPARDHTNKILWLSRRTGAEDLVISASLNGTDLRVQRRVQGGPGPSIINMPKAGCWTFGLTWGTNHDTVAVRYRPS